LRPAQQLLAPGRVTASRLKRSRQRGDWFAPGAAVWSTAPTLPLSCLQFGMARLTTLLADAHGRSAGCIRLSRHRLWSEPVASRAGDVRRTRSALEGFPLLAVRSPSGAGSDSRALGLSDSPSVAAEHSRIASGSRMSRRRREVAAVSEAMSARPRPRSDRHVGDGRHDGGAAASHHHPQTINVKEEAPIIVSRHA
jgi:hypothetical protein